MTAVPAPAPQTDAVALRPASGAPWSGAWRVRAVAVALVAWLVAGLPALLGYAVPAPVLGLDLVLLFLAAAVAPLDGLRIRRPGGRPAGFVRLPALAVRPLDARAAAGLVTALAGLGVLLVVAAAVAFPPEPLAPVATDAGRLAPTLAHWSIAGIVAPLVALAAWLVRRSRGSLDSAAALVAIGAALYVVEIVTGLSEAGFGSWAWVSAVHLWIGGASGASLAAAAAVVLAGRPVSPPVATLPFAGRREALRAYVALTKPRIIELLLVTTVPAMLLAARDAAVDPLRLVALIALTLVGGALGAGSANAINCYLDRDIDEIMTRTRRRPLPGGAVRPDHALVFGLGLGVVSFVLLAALVNLLAAVLTLLAIAFYVVVYTFLLKRTTPQNIVIGGAAGALPPVIGWAAVTGDVSPAPLLLFLIVFYWTPPHFWALSIRLLRDYAAAGVPMLPVVRGIDETNRQILLYTILLVLLTVALVPIGAMGLVYVVGTIGVGAWFLAETVALWRDGTAQRAIRVYKASISYLSLLFALVALDALVTLRP